MRLYSICTASHRCLRDDWFLPSLADEFDLRIEDRPGSPHSGDFRSGVWMDVVAAKLVLLRRAAQEGHEDPALWCDVDVQFFRPCAGLFREAVQDADIAFQRESGRDRINTGVMVFRPGERVRRLFAAAAELRLDRFLTGDQGAIESLLRSGAVPGLRWKVLPDPIFASSQLMTANPLLTAAAAFLPRLMFDRCLGAIPKDIALHHANMTPAYFGTGSVELKLHQLEAVRKRLLDSR